jgi:hypothetical protein
VDHYEAAVYGSIMDRQRRAAKGSLESRLADATGPGSSPWKGEKREVSTGMLTGGYFGRRGGCDEPATKKHGGGKTHSVPSAEEHGEVELSGPNGCG